MRKLIVAVALLVLVVPAVVLAGCGDKKVPAGAIAAVGDGVVTQEQFDETLQWVKERYELEDSAPPFPDEGTDQYDQLKAMIVNYLVDNELMREKAAEMDVEVTDDELQEQVKAIVQQNGGQEQFDELLKQQGYTQERLEEEFKAQMLAAKVQEKVIADIKIGEDELKEYYDNPDNASQFKVSESVDARHVLVKTKARAEKVRTLLEADGSDANWKKVAKKYSTDDGTKDSGGSLGNFTEGRMVESFDKAAFSLAVGEISEPVKTKYGWHVIEVTKKTPVGTQSFDEAKATIEQQLKSQKQETVWNEWLEKAHEDADIVYAAGFNPDELTASPSPDASATGESESETSASPSPAAE